MRYILNIIYVVDTDYLTGKKGKNLVFFQWLQIKSQKLKNLNSQTKRDHASGDFNNKN